MTLGTIPHDTGKAPKRRDNREDRLHKEIVRYIRSIAPTLPLHHSPNEGNRGGKKGALDGARRKAMGVMPGWPDLVLCPHDALYGRVPHGIEIKAEGGRQTDAQKDVEALFSLMGWPYVICRSLDDVTQTLWDWRIPTREVRNG